MRYLLCVIHDSKELATDLEMKAIDVFNAGLQADGYWVMAAGIGAPDTGMTIDARGGAPVITDGHYVESTEYMIGFWIVDVPDRDVAVQLAIAGSRACNRRVEVRPFL